MGKKHKIRNHGKTRKSVIPKANAQSSNNSQPINSTHHALCQAFTPKSIKVTDKSGISKNHTPAQLSELMTAHRGAQFTYAEQLFIPTQPEDLKELLDYAKQKKLTIKGTFDHFMAKIDFSAFEIFYIDETMGYGLRTLRAFKKGELLLPYFGSFINLKNRSQIEKSDDHYLMENIDHYAITAERFGGMASWINWMPSAEFTSGMSEPILAANVIIEAQPLEEGTKLLLPFYKAITDMPPNTQLGCDWGPNFLLLRDITPLVFSLNGQIAPKATQEAFLRVHQQRIDNAGLLTGEKGDAIKFFEAFKIIFDCVRQITDKTEPYVAIMLAHSLSELHISKLIDLESYPEELNKIKDMFSQFPEFVERLHKKQELTIESCFPDNKGSDEFSINSPVFKWHLDDINKNLKIYQGHMLSSIIGTVFVTLVDEKLEQLENQVVEFNNHRFFKRKESGIALKEYEVNQNTNHRQYAQHVK